MKIEGSVALVTGANRGLGASLAAALLDAGAAKVYATARDPRKITDPRLTPLRLDITDPESVRAAAAAAPDVDLLVNNAGIATFTGVFDDESGLRAELEANYLGPLAVSRAFAPILAANGGGALVNCLSVVSWVVPTPGNAGYAASKSAMWAATNALRLALRGQGTLVSAVHMGYLDTDMAASITAPKAAVSDVAKVILAGIEADEYEILADETARRVRSALSAPLTALYPTLATPAAA